MNRHDLFENLKEEDPDYVVDLLGITTAELVAHFPARVEAYLDREAEEEASEEEND